MWETDIYGFRHLTCFARYRIHSFLFAPDHIFGDSPRSVLTGAGAIVMATSSYPGILRHAFLTTGLAAARHCPSNRR
jgi:hypothetical protein